MPGAGGTRKSGILVSWSWSPGCGGTALAVESLTVDVIDLVRHLSDPRHRAGILAILAFEAQRGNQEALIALLKTRDEPDVAAVLERVPRDLIATAWYETRDPDLPCAPVAGLPPQAIVVTELKADCFVPRPELAQELLDACADPDPDVRKRAGACLEADLSDAMRDAFFLACVRGGNPWCVAPADPGLHVIHLLLSGRETEAEACDPEGELLARGIEFLSDGRRLELAANLRKRGLGHLSTVAMGLDLRYPERADHGFQELFPELLAQGRWQELWRLAFHLPVHRTRAIVLALAERGFEGGELFERALPLAAAPVPLPQPLCRLPGRLVAFAGGQVYRFHEGLFFRQHEVLPMESQGARLAEQLAQTLISPDGMWRATARCAIDLFDAEGVRVWHLECPFALLSLDFSPCSRYVRVTFSPHNWHLDKTFSLFRLPSMEPIFQHWPVGLDWQWHGEHAIVWRPGGGTEVDLATGRCRILELPFLSRRRVWKRSPSGTRWVSSTASEVRLFQDGAELRFPPGSADFLVDDRLAIAHENGWSLWDGRRLLSFPGNHREVLDPCGVRALGGDHVQTEVLRFGHPRLARALQGRFRAFQGDRIVTEMGSEIAVWRVPHDLILGRARMEDADFLEPHDRELALLFLWERLRHEVQLEDALRGPEDHAIEL